MSAKDIVAIILASGSVIALVVYVIAYKADEITKIINALKRKGK